MALNGPSMKLIVSISLCKDTDFIGSAAVY